MARISSEARTMNISKILVACSLLAIVSPANAALKVFACEPEWAALAEELGGDRVDVYSATTGLQDVHYIQARPSLIARYRQADLVICTGADLEAGWLPLLARQAGNPRVGAGQPGLLLAAEFVPMLEVPESVDRAEGDIHPYGNPHIQLDPHNIARVASVLAERLIELDPQDRDYYLARQQDFATRWQQAIAAWEERGRSLAGMGIVVHHRSWVYLQHWLDLTELGSLEPKPGIEPSASYLAALLAGLQGKDLSLIIRSAYQSSRASDWLAKRTGAPGVVVPQTVGAVPGATDLFSWFDTILKQLEAGRR